MGKKEIKRLNKQAAGSRERKCDKMGLSFVLPLVLFYTVIGLLLILLNEWVTNIAACALAAGLVLVGVWLLLRYLRFDVERRIAGTDLAVGLILLLTGVLLIISPDDLREIFPKVWGLSLVFGGFLKIQYAFDEKTVGIRKWWIMLIFAAVSLAIGVLALFNRSIFGENQNVIIGAFMLAEAVLDLVTWILITRGMKRLGEENETPVPAEPAECPEPAEPSESDMPAEPAESEKPEPVPDTDTEE